jgi:hypothetical protein
MDALLFSSDSGALVLVPPCFEPSQALERLHGRFKQCCRMSIDNRKCKRLRTKITAEFDRCGYAMLEKTDVEQLFNASSLWGFSDRRRNTREAELSYAIFKRRYMQSDQLVHASTDFEPTSKRDRPSPEPCITR